ncbi:MAG: hypothetical protein KatS3mg068_0859 [Candidatus Sericytochromatia bacterium]|nr:MAG: hypothetical protein KatS3mg068_0859 [Candidatus Sericytochromatia bacterium]
MIISVVLLLECRDKYLTDENDFTPYNYGYIVEVGVRNGKSYIKNNLKHYAMGKGAPEMAIGNA